MASVIDGEIIEDELVLSYISDTELYDFDASQTGDIDGQGRLVVASETISLPAPILPQTHDLSYSYDLMGQLTYAAMTNIGGSLWTSGYDYSKDGNIYNKTENAVDTEYGYNGDLMDYVGLAGLEWDFNGRLTAGTSFDFKYNLDGKLQTATDGTTSVELKYDPMGNRVLKYSTDGMEQIEKQFIVDIVGQLPTILCEIDVPGSSLITSYIYDGNAQVLCQLQHGVDPITSETTVENKYFYLHDRLGSVRLRITGITDVEATEWAEVVNSYTYDPYGSDLTAECVETAYNPFKYTGQWYDAEINQYYLRARMYDPQLMRFTTRDPVRGEPCEPLTLHKYLYTANDPINRIDPSGEIAANIASGVLQGATTYSIGVNLMVASINYLNDNRKLSDFLWAAGEFAFKLTPYAIAHGLANPISIGKKQMVSQWPSRSGNGNWVQLGSKNWLSYGFSGMIGRGRPGGQYYQSGIQFLVDQSRLSWPSGAEFFKGLFGQRILLP